MIQVMIGAVIGSVLRVYLSRFNGAFPVATLSINCVGSLLLGVIAGLNSYYLLLGTGVMGGLTTFSTFTVETIRLYKEEPKSAVIYVTMSLILPLLLFSIGYYATH